MGLKFYRPISNNSNPKKSKNEKTNVLQIKEKTISVVAEMAEA
ncbi:hypothetical protein [Flavobacterium ustbae]|nr:hypothetical protein [Flavobacterium ustbae]